MTNQEQRIQNIRKRIKTIDLELKKVGRPTQKTICKIEQLYDRRDLWEERLAQAELA